MTPQLEQKSFYAQCLTGLAVALVPVLLMMGMAMMIASF